MKKQILLISTLFALPLLGENGGSFLYAERTPNASMMLRGGVSNATPVVFNANADISGFNIPEAPIQWGMDTAWDSEDNVTRGTNFIGVDVMNTGRVSFQPSDLVDADGNLSAAQQAALQSRLNHIMISGVRSVALNCDHEVLNKSNYYGKPKEWYRVIKASIKYIRSKGFTVLSVSPFNEPDYTEWGEGTMSHFRSIAQLISEDEELAGIRISAGNTLNCDKALTWYNFMKPYVTEGNTHQLAGSFDTYASFWKRVRSDGNYATADELHNVGEAFIGVHYGLQAGIWWGWDGAARGEYCKAAYYGKEIGYAENRAAWTAATVYKRNDGRTDAFIGSSERQANTSSYDFVATDRPVFYDGYGPVYNYTMTVPGGTGYQVGQTNAERIINIHSGEDVPLEPIVGGTFVIMNVNSNMCLGFYNGARGDLNITQMAYSSSSSATHQRWIVEPVAPTVGGDYSYFVLRNVRDEKQVMDVKNWSTAAGGEIIGIAGGIGANEQWFAEYAGNGNWYIRSRHSGLYLEIRNASKFKNAYLQQAAFTGEANQQWRFMPTNAKLEQSAPAAPKGLKATALSASVQLEWIANSETDLAGYVVLRAAATSDPALPQSWDVIGRLVSGTTFIDNSAEPGIEYVYKLKAVDRSRNQSAASETVAACYGGNDAAPALIAHYTFDSDAAETATSIEDATENVSDAAVEGTLTFDANNKQNGMSAVALSGQAYLMLPPAVAHQKTMTVSLWANVSGKDTWQRLFDFGNGTEQYFFLTPDNGTEMRVVLKNGGDEQILSASKPSEGWHHFTVTLSEDNVTLYVDGESVASTSDITIRPADFKPVRNYIGRSQFPADPLLKATIDDLQIYNTALTAEQVKAVMNGDIPTSVTSVDGMSGADVQYNIYNVSGQKVSSRYASDSGNSLKVAAGNDILIYKARP